MKTWAVLFLPLLIGACSTSTRPWILDLTSAKLTGPNSKGEYRFCYNEHGENPTCKNVPANEDIWVEAKQGSQSIRALFRRGDK